MRKYKTTAHYKNMKLSLDKIGDKFAWFDGTSQLAWGMGKTENEAKKALKKTWGNVVFTEKIIWGNEPFSISKL